MRRTKSYPDETGLHSCNQGNTRICCPMSRYKQKLREIKEFPHVKRLWCKAIKQIRADNIGDNMIINNYWGDGTEDEKCEQVFNWWISGKAYDEWYAETYLQGKLNFN